MSKYNQKKINYVVTNYKNIHFYEKKGFQTGIEVYIPYGHTIEMNHCIVAKYVFPENDFTKFKNIEVILFSNDIENNFCLYHSTPYGLKISISNEIKWLTFENRRYTEVYFDRRVLVARNKKRAKTLNACTWGNGGKKLQAIFKYFEGMVIREIIKNYLSIEIILEKEGQKHTLELRSSENKNLAVYLIDNGTEIEWI